MLPGRQDYSTVYLSVPILSVSAPRYSRTAFLNASSGNRVYQVRLSHFRSRTTRRVWLDIVLSHRVTSPMNLAPGLSISVSIPACVSSPASCFLSPTPQPPRTHPPRPNLPPSAGQGPRRTYFSPLHPSSNLPCHRKSSYIPFQLGPRSSVSYAASKSSVTVRCIKDPRTRLPPIATSAPAR